MEPKERREYNLIVRFKKVPTRKNSIHAMCFHCFEGTEDEMPDEGYQKLIGNCTDKECPLHTYRPYKNQKRTD